jgi:hypothetical protein
MFLCVKKINVQIIYREYKDKRKSGNPVESFRFLSVEIAKMEQ